LARRQEAHPGLSSYQFLSLPFASNPDTSGLVHHASIHSQLLASSYKSVIHPTQTFDLSFDSQITPSTSLFRIEFKMISTRVNSKLCSPKQVAQLGRAVAPIYHANSSLLGYPVALRIACAAHQPQHASTPRSFSTTSVSRLRDFFPPKETVYIRQTPPAWPHEGYTEEQMLSVVPDHRPPRTIGDTIAWRLVRLCRYA